MMFRIFLMAALAGALTLGCGDDDPMTGTDAGGTDTATGTDGTTGTDSTTGTDMETSDMNIVETARAAGSFTTLIGALERTGLDSALAGEGPFTVFAPTDAAFTALGADLDALTDEQLTTILQNHVVSGNVPSSAIPATADNLADLTLLFSTTDGVTVNGSPVSMADVGASNGVIHIVDAVIMPANIVDMVGIAGFTELGGAVGAASPLGDGTAVADALASAGPFTVFAPNNAAFEAVSDVVEGLTADQVRDVLLFHVASGRVLSTDLSAGEVPTLLEGQSVTVDLTDGVRVEEASVSIADIKVTNGVIHVIDAVMIPPS